jgi:hypothetical protein
MSTPDALWEWIRPPLQEMNKDSGAPWPERRQAFLGRLGLSDASQHPVVDQLLQRLDDAPEDERDKILNGDELESLASQIVQEHGVQEHGVSGEPTGETQAGEQAAGYDEQAWQAYLAQNGAQWDGTEESWEQFAQWFAHYAGQQGLTAPATALLDYLSAQPAAQRIDTLAQYGVTITPPAGQPAAEEITQEQYSAALGNAMAQVPGAAALNEAELAAVAARVRELIQTQGAPS